MKAQRINIYTMVQICLKNICINMGAIAAVKNYKQRCTATRSVYIQGVSGGIVNFLGGCSMDYSE